MTNTESPLRELPNPPRTNGRASVPKLLQGSHANDRCYSGAQPRRLQPACSQLPATKRANISPDHVNRSKLGLHFASTPHFRTHISMSNAQFTSGAGIGYSERDCHRWQPVVSLGLPDPNPCVTKQNRCRFRGLGGDEDSSL